MSNVTSVPSASAVANHGIKLMEGRISQILSGSSSSASVPHYEPLSNSTATFSEFTYIPNTEGFFMLNTDGAQQPVQVVLDSGFFYIKTFSGQRMADLCLGQTLMGPISSINELSGLKVTKSKRSSIPSLPEFERDSIITKQDYISVEHDLSEALDYVEKLRSENKELAKSLKNHSSKKQAYEFQAAKEEMAAKIQVAAQRASVAEDEASAAFAELDELKLDYNDLSEKASSLESLVNSLKSAKEAASGSPKLSGEFIQTVNRIKTLLLHIKMSSKEPSTYKLLDNLVKGLSL
ncbi:hypothetical protein [Pseudoalteromonas marina]|uniref:Uncharacterized protein n=1 Tax=Pseudoalteromonas marina TaxID=267375 RepID=A0ABT9FH50_9GAMM|nr:hypothetical protein [Pseudoalteromonas marina]MDP2565821.1 hypothetical protein [Pseudoalteromonas marina]